MQVYRFVHVDLSIVIKHLHSFSYKVLFNNIYNNTIHINNFLGAKINIILHIYIITIHCHLLNIRVPTYSIAHLLIFLNYHEPNLKEDF